MQFTIHGYSCHKMSANKKSSLLESFHLSRCHRLHGSGSSPSMLLHRNLSGGLDLSTDTAGRSEGLCLRHIPWNIKRNLGKGGGIRKEQLLPCSHKKQGHEQDFPRHIRDPIIHGQIITVQDFKINDWQPSVHVRLFRDGLLMLQ